MESGGGGGGGGGGRGEEFACIMSCEQSQVNHSREGLRSLFVLCRVNSHK